MPSPAFDLARRWRVPPRTDLRVVEGDQRIGDHPCAPDARVEQAKVARMRRMEQAALQQINDLCDQRAEVMRVRQLLRREPRVERIRRERRRYACVSYVDRPLDDAFRQDPQRVLRRRRR
jgi:hypothetical protein